MTKSSYYKREYRQNPKIQKQKQGVNTLFAKLAKRQKYKGKCLIIDSFKENTRKSLTSQAKYFDEEIITIDRESKLVDTNHFKMDLDKHLSQTNDLYHDVFADTVNSPKNSIQQTKDLFQRQLLSLGGTFAITCCLRGITSKQFSYFQPQLFRLANKTGYKLNPINIPAYLRMNKKSTYKIKSNMSDNGAYKKTGRTVTAFYKVS